MKKKFHLCLGILLVLSLALPIYLTAGNLTLILPDGSGAGIADQPFDSFFLDSTGNLHVVLPTFPDINNPQVTWTLSCPLGSGCTVNPDGASITADADAAFSFKISSTSTADVTNAYPPSSSGANFSTKNPDGTYTFTWSRPAGNYIAVFRVGQPPVWQSQKVVDIVVVAPDPVVKFVTNFYQKILGQPLSPTDAWVSALKNHTQTGEDIATAFFITSQQGQSLTVNDFVRLLYEIILMRIPYQPDVDYWAGTGLSRADLLHFFVTSQEFAAKCNTLGILAYTLTYTVTVDNPTQTGGSISPASRTVNAGGTATFTVIITQGYTATPSTGNLSGTTGTVTWTIPSVNSSIHVSITFTLQTPPVNPPPDGGEVLLWNRNHVIVQFQPNETKTFIARVTTNQTGAYAKAFEIVFSTMGVSVTGSFKMPLKPDGNPYRTSVGRTEFTGIHASNEAAITISVSAGGLILDPYIYPGDFILTLTADSKGGWGYMSTSLYY